MGRDGDLNGVLRRNGVACGAHCTFPVVCTVVIIPFIWWETMLKLPVSTGPSVSSNPP